MSPEYRSGFCGSRRPEAHRSCSGTSKGAGGESHLNCACECHAETGATFLQEMFEATAWRTVDRETNETLYWATEAEARAYAKSKEPACEDCNGVGAVPASGGEPAEEVDNGYVQCPTCGGGLSTGDGLGDVPDLGAAVQPQTDAGWSRASLYDADSPPRVGRNDRLPDLSRDLVSDRDRHLTDEGSKRLAEWANERRETV